jgi:hypothetical protein
MAEASVTPEASVASPGLGLRYVGQHCYAYSGTVDVDATETNLLKFTSGSGYIVARWLPQYMVESHVGDDFRFVVYFNDQVVASVIMAAAADRDAFYRDVDLIIPPLTEVKMTADNKTQNVARLVGGILTGRIYGAE